MTITLTGFLDEEATEEDAGTRFRVCVSPTDDRIDELALPCNVTDPELARAVLNEFQPGDKIRVTGHLALPRVAGQPIRLHVTTLELLDTAPLRLTDSAEDLAATHAAESDAAAPTPATLSEQGLLERFGPYLVYADPDTCADSIWTETGEWVGTAIYPTTAADLINAHQHRLAGGDM